MVASLNSASARSGSIISGSPAVATAYGKYARNHLSILYGAIGEALFTFEKKVKEQAANQWGELADYIRIRLNTKTLTISFDVIGPYAKQAEELEYGSSGQSPQAVLRNAAVEATQALPRMIEQNIVKRMFK